MLLNPHVMVAKRWVSYKEFVVQSLKLVRRTFLLITSGSEIYNVQFLSTHTVILKQAFWWDWEICWIKVFGHRNSNHLVFQMGFVKSIPILPIGNLEVLKKKLMKNWDWKSWKKWEEGHKCSLFFLELKQVLHWSWRLPHLHKP